MKNFVTAFSSASRMAGFVVLALFCIWPAHAEADDRVKAVQLILKAENFFFGDANGQMNEETATAIRRFQIARGLKISGELDAETWAALSPSSSSQPAAAQVQSQPKTSPPPASGSAKASATPDAAQPPPARERARSVVQSDREFLKNIESTGSATPSPKSSLRSARASPRSMPAREERSPVSAQLHPEESPVPAVAAEQAEKDRITAQDVQEFVADYLRAAQSAEPSAEMAHYADTKVDYFDSGRVDRRAIERDQQRYYQRWPQRTFTLLSPPKIVDNSHPGEAAVTFIIAYRVSNGSNTAQGRTENAIRLKRFPDGLKITAIRERKIRD